MNQRVQWALFILVGAAALVTGLLLHREDETPVSPQASQVLLAATFPDLGGQQQRLEQWKGKVLVVNFWATWCAPCREEIPAFVRAQERLRAKGLQVVGIAIDQPDKVKPYAAEMKINYPVLIGELEAIDLSRAAGNRVGGLPYTVVLDRSGKVVIAQLGGVTEEKLDKMLSPYL